MSLKVRRLLLRPLVSVTAILAVVCVAANLTVGAAGDGRCFDTPEAVPAKHVAMVLGCPKYDSWNGRPSEYYQNRVNAAAALFKAGKCDLILVSSDVDARTMLADVRAAGVPDDRLLYDPLGVRTLDSMVRARTIFGVTDGIVVSQRYHNERALYLAQSDGTNWVGYDAAEVSGFGWLRAHCREMLARVKAWLDVNLHTAKPVSTKPVKTRRQ